MAAAVLAMAGAVDVLVAAVPGHALRIGWDIVPAYGLHRYALTAAGVACLAAAPAVARGRREARWVGIVAASASALIALVHDADLLAFVPSVGAVGALLAAGPLPGRSDPLLARRGLRTLIVGEMAVFLYAAVGLYLLDANFYESTNVGTAIQEALRMLFLLPPSAIQPATDHGAWFLDSIRWLSALVLGVAFVRALAPSLAFERRRHDSDRVRHLLEQWGTSSLAPFHVLDDKHWCFSGDGEAFVGYALSGSTAVALGGPVGAPASRSAAVQSFLDTCERQSWTPAFHQVDQADATLLRTLGMHLVKIGEEAVVDVTGFSLSGGSMKPIRKAVGRAEREGLTAIELSLPVEDATLAELRSISDAWLAASGHRERGFTLGPFDADRLRESPVVLIRDATGRAVAFANIVPSYRSAVGNFDLMRRLPDAPKGTMELLFVTLIERFRSEGLSAMSLGLAPLAGVQGDSAIERVLGLMRDQGRFMNFSGLETFKAKWRPRWEPRYFAYPGSAHLPRSAAATALAGERLGRGPRADALARTARRFPVSLAISGVLLWPMVATAGDPGYHASLAEQMSLSWPDLAELRWWRIPLSTMIQEDAGIRWSIVAMLPALFLVEARLGWRILLLVFVASDALSSLATLSALQGYAEAGAAGAGELAAEPNLGSSSGLAGLLGAWVASLTPTPRRRWAIAALGLGLLAGLAVERDLAAVQHASAAIVGASIMVLVRRRPWTRMRRPVLTPRSSSS